MAPRSGCLTVDIDGQICAAGSGCSSVTGLRPAVRELTGFIANARNSVNASLARVQSRQLELAPAARTSGQKACAVPAVPSTATIGIDTRDAADLSSAAEAERALAMRSCQRAGQPSQNDADARIGELRRIKSILLGYQAEIRQAGAVRANGDTLLARIANAGTQLREHAVGIQNQVNEEVLKLQPEPAAILQALGNMRALGFQISGASALAPKAAPAISAESAVSAKQLKRQEEEEVAVGLQATVDTMDQLRTAERELRNYLNQAQALSEQTAKLTQCTLIVPGQMSIVPDVDNVILGAGGTQVFLVSGGRGAPIAEVAGAGTDRVEAKVEVAGTAHKITVTLKSGLLEHEILYLHIADGNGKQRVINITGGGAAAGPSETSLVKDATNKTLCEAFQLGSSNSCAASAVVMDCRKKLGQDVMLQMTEDDARKVIAAKKDGRCDS